MGREYMQDIKNAVQSKYEPGMDKAALVEEIFQQFTGPVDPTKLDNPMASFIRPKIIREEARAPRKAASDQARRQLIEMQLAPLDRPNVKLLDRMGRAHTAVCYYFQHIGKPEMIDRYEELFRVREEPEVRIQALQAQGVSQKDAEERVKAEDLNLPYERGHFIAELMDQFHEYTSERLLSMKAEEVQEKLPEMAFLHAISMNVELYLRHGADYEDDISFIPEDYKKVEYLNNVYPAASYAMCQFTTKANPYYELIDVKSALSTITMEDTVMCYAMQNDDSLFGDMICDLASASRNQHTALFVSLQNGLKERGIDLKQPFTSVSRLGEPIDLTGQSTADHYDYFKSSGEVCVEQGDKTVMISMQKRDGQIQAVDCPMEAAFNATYRNNLTEISADMKSADPWYIHSSDNFRTMKRRFEELTELGDLLDNNPTVRDQQKAKLDDLKTASAKYLQDKGLVGKNDLEKKRIALAQKILNMATRKLDVLERPKRAARAIAAAEMQEINAEAPNIARFQQKGRAFAGLPTLPNTRHMTMVNTMLENGMENMVNSQPDMNALDQPIDRTTGSAEEKLMAYMTIKALILNDQAGRTREKPGLITGVINELSELDPFVTTVRAMPSYKEALANMTKKDLYNFVVKNEVKQLAKRVREDIVTVGSRQREHTQAVPQAQRNAPQKEQSGRHI